MNPVRASIALLMLLVGLLWTRPAAAQSATGYFHQAAQQYINEQPQAALATIAAGLRIEPTNAKLQALRAKIRRQQRQQGNRAGGQQSASNQQSQTAENGEQGQSRGSPGEQRPSPGAQPQGASGQDGRRTSENDARSASPSGASEGQRTERQGRPQDDPGTLSRTQAERILQAMALQEKQLLREVLRSNPSSQQILKDW